MLVFKDIKVGYHSVLLQTPEVHLEKGKVYGFIGPNGTGKTTTLNTILGCTPLIEGDVFWDNQSIFSLSNAQRVQLISFVPSRIEGVRNMTVRELIGLGRTPYTNLFDVRGKVDEDIVDEVIHLLGISRIQHKCTTMISDGERQIASIGKALAQKTAIIVLDEPTAFLDYRNRRNVLGILKDAASKWNKLILFTTHDLELAYDYVDEFMAIQSVTMQLVMRSKVTSLNELIEEIFPK